MTMIQLKKMLRLNKNTKLKRKSKLFIHFLQLLHLKKV